MGGMYYTEFEEIRIGRVRHRWAATYILSCFYKTRKVWRKDEQIFTAITGVFETELVYDSNVCRRGWRCGYCCDGGEGYTKSD